MFSYAYAVMTLFFVVIWVVLFILLRRSRPAIFWTSFILAMAGPVGEYWLNPGYWHPIYLVNISYRGWHFGLEDFFVTFAIAGISAGIFESIALRKGFTELPHITSKVPLRMLGLCTLGFLIMVFLASGIDLSPIHALLLAVIIPSFIMLYRKWETFALIIPIAVICGALFWLFYVFFFIPLFPGVIQALWNLDATLGIMLAGVPLEEMLWAFTAALFAGPVYRVCCSNFLRNRNIPQKRW